MEKRKSLLAILMVLTFALTFANCGSGDEKTEGEGETAAATDDAAAVTSKCVQGDCKNGTGTAEFSDGDKYEGGFKDGKFSGEGAYMFANGDTYKGNFAEDKFDGKGVYSYKSGDKYEGDFKNDLFNGKGTYTTKDSKLVGNFKDGKADGDGELTSTKGVYKGLFKEDLPSGKGVLKNKEGKVIYEGEFVNGQPVITGLGN